MIVIIYYTVNIQYNKLQYTIQCQAVFTQNYFLQVLLCQVQEGRQVHNYKFNNNFISLISNLAHITFSNIVTYTTTTVVHLRLVHFFILYKCNQNVEHRIVTIIKINWYLHVRKLKYICSINLSESYVVCQQSELLCVVLCINF